MRQSRKKGLSNASNVTQFESLDQLESTVMGNEEDVHMKELLEDNSSKRPLA